LGKGYFYGLRFGFSRFARSPHPASFALSVTLASLVPLRSLADVVLFVLKRKTYYKKKNLRENIPPSREKIKWQSEKYIEKTRKFVKTRKKFINNEENIH